MKNTSNNIYELPEMIEKTITHYFHADSTRNRKDIKQKIIFHNLIPYRCAQCENTGEWYNNKLILHLDHINGIRNDHRLENLRFLCPNCHSQTDTYSGKNNTKSDINRVTDDQVIQIIEKYSNVSQILRHFSMSGSQGNYTRIKQIIKNSGKQLKRPERKKKIIWPTVSFMLNYVWQKPTTIIAKELGVTDKAVEKFCKLNNIPKPPRGYWAKKENGSCGRI